MFAVLGAALGMTLLALGLVIHRRRSTNQFGRLKERPFVIGRSNEAQSSKPSASSYI